jgi:ATP-dependent Lon protease
MPAERWQSGINEFLQSIGETDDELIKMIMSSVLTHSQKSDDASSAPQAGEKNEGQKFPDVLPILPLRGVVVYPNTAVPLTVGQVRSIKLVDDVVGGDKLVGLVAALDPEQETPGPNELYKVGTIATVHRLLRAPDGTVRLLVQGMERFRLGEFVAEEPYLKAHVHLIPETVDTEAGLETGALARNAP